MVLQNCFHTIKKSSGTKENDFIYEACYNKSLSSSHPTEEYAFSEVAIVYLKEIYARFNMELQEISIGSDYFMFSRKYMRIVSVPVIPEESLSRYRFR